MKRDTLINFYKKHQQGYSHTLSTHAKTRLKTRILQNLRVPSATHAERARRVWGFSYAKLSLATAGFVLLLSGTAYASSAAIPGDVLYPVKRAVEETRVKFASNSETKAKLQVQFAEERLQELETVALKAPLKMKVTTVIQADPAAATPPATATHAPMGIAVEPEPEREITQAENSAREEVSRALKKLEKTRDDLSKQGKVVAANNLAKTINLLSGRVGNKKDRENFDQKRNDGRVKGSTRAPKKDNTQTEADSRPNEVDSDKLPPSKD